MTWIPVMLVLALIVVSFVRWARRDFTLDRPDSHGSWTSGNIDTDSSDYPGDLGGDSGSHHH